MNIRYVFLSILLIGLGIILAFLPEKHHSPEISPKDLLAEINNNTRFFSCDQVANSIIEADPLLQLIDVRTPEEYKKFSLPGAINIPLDSLLIPDWEAYIDQADVVTVFFSNGTVFANQAWVIYRRKAFDNLYVMKGGLNSWVETILRPQEPSQIESQEEFEKYSFRLAASQYFGGGKQDVSNSTKNKRKKVLRKKRKKGAVEGGCS